VNNRGMTLIEIALAVAIVAMMGTITAGTIGTSFDAYEAVQEIDSKHHNVRVALNRMARDISLAFLTNRPRLVADEDKLYKTIFKGEPNGSVHTLNFTSLSHEILREDAKESDQCEIGYFGDSDPDNRDQENVMRREDPRLDGEPEEGGRAHILAEDIKELKFRYWDTKQDDWTDEWDTEDPEFVGRLPRFVEITLVIEDTDGTDATFVTKTRIYNTKVLNIR